MLKKNLLLLSALGIAFGSAFAGKAPVCKKPLLAQVPTFVTIPHLTPGFEFNVAALWLRPGASNLNYVILNNELPAQSPSWNEQELKPSFTTGFNIGIGYVFPNCEGQDIHLGWTHLNTSDSTTTIARSDAFFLGPDYEVGPDAIPIRNAKSTAKFNYDVVNLDAGQYVNFGEHLQMRFFGGLSAAYLQEQLNTTFSGTTPGPFSMLQAIDSRFRGIGPRFGIFADYTCNGFGVLGEAGASALIGSLRSTTNFTGGGPELLALFGQTTNHQFVKDQEVYQVIPGFDAKLGLEYKYACNGFWLSASAGYQAAVYVNAISQYIPQSLVGDTPITSITGGGIFIATMSHTLSNYSVQGPFVNLAVKF